MNSLYYRDARLIEEELEQAGRPDWALRIDDAIEAGGSSGAEILLQLRTTLIQIQKQRLALPAQLDDQIEDLASAIGRALA
jgi:hypothetical protein